MEELNNNTDNSNEDNSNTNLNSYSIDPMNSPSLSVMTTEQQQYIISSADIYTWKLKKTHDG